MKAFLTAVVFFGFVLGLAILAVVTPSRWNQSLVGEADED